MIIYLYVKQHQITGLKYFGKTVRDPYTYKGSGIYWQRHIRAHGDNIETLSVWSFNDQDQCSSFAKYFSETNNIVESQEWANLTIEDGINTPPSRKGKKCSTEHVEKSRKSRTGAKRSNRFRKTLSEIKTGIKLGPASDTRKRAIAESKIGKVWFTNPSRTEQVLCEIGAQPIGWIRGCKKRKKHS